MAKENDAQNPSMEQILQTIRGVISGEESSAGQVADNDDVLELTEMVEADGSITSLVPEQTATPDNALPSTDTPDVLANIDQALSDEGKPADIPMEATPSQEAETPSPFDLVAAPAELSNAPEPPQADNTVEAILAAPPVEEAAAPASDAMPLPAPNELQSTGKQRLISEATAKASTNALAALMRNLPKHKVDGPSFQSGLTLEELVVEALKPELSNWLDKNLPALVTQLVEKEIKKILPQPEE